MITTVNEKDKFDDVDNNVMFTNVNIFQFR